MYAFKKCILWVWQFPQNILAILIALILAIFKKSKNYGKYKGNQLIYTDINIFGASFGDYIFVNSTFDARDLDHETGHSKQSDYLGPLYLFVIGMPSVLHFWVRHIMRQFGKRPAWRYYDFYTEKWADRLGGVKNRYK